MNQKLDFLSKEEVKGMIKLSTPLNLRLGKAIFDKGEIEIIEFTVGIVPVKEIRISSANMPLLWDSKSQEV